MACHAGGHFRVGFWNTLRPSWTRALAGTCSTVGKPRLQSYGARLMSATKLWVLMNEAVRPGSSAQLTSVVAAALLALACGGSGSGGDPEPKPEADTPHESAKQCDDGDDNDDDGFTDCDDLDCRAESDDCPFAPEPDRSIISNLTETSKFLYTGPDPVQKDFDEDALDRWRTSLIHGTIVDADGDPLRDVRVSVKDHPEYGFTETRFDGRYDLVVNGGSVLVLNLEHERYVRAQRSVATEWQREHVVPDVGLIPRSDERHRVNIGSGELVLAEAVEDDYGKRQPFLVFPEWLEAEAVLPDGDTESLGELTLQVTQYPFEPATPTVPNSGARFSPGSLPSHGGFNYSIDVSVEEAEELGATSVRFSEPVAYYVENFLGLPAGTPVPLHSYDPTTSEWETMGPGVVIEIVDIQAGLAQLDADGDGDADDTDALEELGVFRQEREELARRFDRGDTLMRNRVTHFSTLTQIWNVISGGTPAPPDLAFSPKANVDDPLWRGNVLVEERVAREAVDLVGTPLTLVYQGNRAHGHTAAFHVEIPLVGEIVPPGLSEVFVVVDIAGRLFPENPNERRLTPEAGLTQEFIWDGKNSFGQLLQGEQIAKVWVGYAFAGASLPGLELLTPQEVQDALPFALPSTVIWSFQNVLLGMLDSQGFQFGGFGLDIHHAFDPARQILYYGDGRQRTADGLLMQIVALDQSASAIDSQGQAINELAAPDSMAVADDGSVFVSDDGDAGRVWRISPSGNKEVVLGSGAPGAAGDVELLGPQGIALDPTDNTLFVVDWEGLKVVFLRPSGQVGVLLGDDPSAIISEPLSDPDGLVVGPNRELYVSDANRVLKINVSAGQLEDATYVGGVEPGALSEVLPVMSAKEVPLEQASGLAVDKNTHALFVASRLTHQVWRVETNGEAFLVAGTGSPGFSGDGGLAVDAELHGPRGVALGNDGSLFISDQENFRVRRVFPSGEITTVAGGGDDFPGSVTAGPRALVNRPDGLAFGPDGSLFAGGGAVDTEPPHLFRLSPAATGVVGAGEFLVPSDDGMEAYRFDQNGRHLETIDVITGVTRLTFDYNDQNLLEGVRDTFDVTTSITRDSAGLAREIIGPFGHKNELSYTDEGALEAVEAAVDEGADHARTARFEYDPDTSLLNVAEGGEGAVTSYRFDSLGRISERTDPLGVVETYSAVGALSSLSVSVQTGNASEPDVYARSFLGLDANLGASSNLFDAASFSDRDAQSVSKTELFDRSFTAALAGGARVAGVTSASDQWGEQVRFPSQTTLTTTQGRTLSHSFDISVSGLDVSPTGQVADPLDFDSFEATAVVAGATYRQTFDRASRTLTRTSPEGRTTITVFNDKGLPERQEVPGLADKLFSYDDIGRISTVTEEADGETRQTRFEYGDDGNLRAVTDPLGQTTLYGYDGIGRTTSVTRDDGAATAFGYDDNDNLTAVSPPGRPEHNYVYESGVRLSGYEPPAVATSSGANLPTGNISYEFDEFSRPQRLTLADGSTLESHYFQDFYRPSQLWVTPGGSSNTEVFYMTYNSSDKDLLQSVFGPRNGVVFDYDPPLLTRTEFQTDSASGIINLDYDEALRVSELRLVGSAPVPFTYDSDSLLTQVGPLSITRDEVTGFPTGTNVASVTTSETRNGFGELKTNTADFSGEELFAQTFERDALGRITEITEKVLGVTKTKSFTYDSVGRLSSATIDGETTDYFYDENGNRFPDAALSEASYDDQDRIERFESLVFESTPTGDLLRRDHADPDSADPTFNAYELVYDPRGSLDRAAVTSLEGTSSVRYESDPFGRRVGRQLNGGAPKGWLYGDDLRIIAEIDNNAARTDFVYAMHANVPDLIFKNGTTFFRLIKDHLGSVRLVVNVETGEVVQQLDYDPWGKVVEDSNPGFQPFGFAGGLYDSATKLVRFGARDYDADLGRWVAKDPIGLAGGINVYVYCNNDPINCVDLDGFEPSETDKLISELVIFFVRDPIMCVLGSECSTAEAALFVATGSLSLRARSVWRGIKAARLTALYARIAQRATHNPLAKEVVLGKFNEAGVSYLKVAKARGATFFDIDNWDDVVKKVGESNVWNINAAFIRQQVAKGKSIIFSHDPGKATGFFLKEVNLLKDLGYKTFVKDGAIWKALK